MKLGIALGLLISTLRILHNCNASPVYDAQCAKKDPYIPFPGNDPQHYLICFSQIGDPKEYTCPPYLTFYKETRSCSYDLGITSEGTCTSAEDKLPNSDDKTCKQYYTCSGPGAEPELSADPCEEGFLFNPLLQKCVPDTEFVCDDEGPNCDDPFYKNRNWVNKESCDSYYECADDILVERKCQNGWIFSAVTQVCMLDDGECKGLGTTNPDLEVNIETICKGNVKKYLPDPYYCKAYYYCIDESTPYWSPCPDDKFFANGSCVTKKPDNCACEDLEWEVDGPTSVKVPHSNEEKFYVCREGKLPEVKSCPSGTVFNATKKNCVERLGK